MTKHRLAIPLLVAALFPAAASATTRYVASDGSISGTCASNAPCALPYALSLQQNGDEYVIGPGTYSTAVVLSASNLNVHGTPGQARPIITSASNTMDVTGTGATVSGLEIDTATSLATDAIEAPGGGTFDNLVISATGPSGAQGPVSAFVAGASAALSNTSITDNKNGFGAPNGTVFASAGTLTLRAVSITDEDSFEASDVAVGGANLDVDGLRLLGAGNGGIFVRSGTATISHALVNGTIAEKGSSVMVSESLIFAHTGVAPAVGTIGAGSAIALRDDTVVATAPGVDAIGAVGAGGGTTITATNVIARGRLGATDLDATLTNTINVDHSNFASASGNVNDLGGNQHADPQFVNSAAADFHLKSTSPALDAGTATGIPAGDTALDGNPRIPPKTVDCAQQVDMGAYELTVGDSACLGPPPRGKAAAPTCTAKLNSSHVHVVQKHKRRTSTLTVSAECDQAGEVTLVGFVSARGRKHHKQQFALENQSAAVRAGVADSLSVRLPVSAIAALEAGKRESVTFTLSESNLNGSANVTATVGHLRLR